MIKIGDFSKLSQVSVKTLRYYDEMGLLSPLEVDRFTGYRYYSASQLPRLNRILALKDLGFTLEQIAQILNDGVTFDQLRGMLMIKKAEQEQRVQEEQDRLARVEARLRQIEMENVMSNYEVVLKKVEPLHVASVRGVVPTYAQQASLWNELYGQIGRYGNQFVGACLTLYYDEEYKEHDVEVEVCQPIGGKVNTQGRVKVYELPAATMACTVHHGPFSTISQAYNALIKWIETNGYRVVNAAREVNLQPPAQAGMQNDPNTVTEIQFPVEKV
jgi:effector-binding domain-containing protein